jgi:hypothetical protein
LDAEVSVPANLSEAAEIPGLHEAWWEYLDTQFQRHDGNNVWVPGIRSPHATCAYSWISPPSRSRRVTFPAGRSTDGSAGPSGGACPNARCGRWRL